MVIPVTICSHELQVSVLKSRRRKPEGIAYIGAVDGKEWFLLIYDGDTLQAELAIIEPSN